MKRIRSRLLLLLSVLVLPFSLTVWTVYRELRQERLNRDLIAAVKNNDAKAVVTLLDQGADSNCHDEPYQPIPWWQMLRDRLRGVRPPPSTAPTPLLLALQRQVTKNGYTYPPENLTLIKALLDHKADVNVKSQRVYSLPGFPALEYAMMSHKIATVHLLLKYGADMRPDAVGLVPLVDAEVCCSDSTDVLSDMLQRGADVNQREGSELTALWVAVDKLNVAAVRLLLSYHADVTLRATMYSSPGHKVERVTLLEEAKRMEDNSALNRAKAKQIVHLLEQAGAKE